MKRFSVCCKITGYLSVEVAAETQKEAEEKALNRVGDCDLNDISFLDTEIDDVEELK